jgi:signal transduction histidine kinase
MERFPAPPAPERLDPSTCLRQQQESLREIVECIAGGADLRSILTQITELACRVLSGDYGAFGLYDPERDLIRLEAVYNLSPQEIGLELRRGTGLSGRVLETRAPVVLDRYHRLDAMPAPEMAEHAALAVPIFWRDQLVGTLAMTAAPPKRFRQDDVNLAMHFACHAAIAIHEARQNELESERNSRLDLLARIGRTFAAGLQLDALCESAVEVIHQLMGFPNVGLGLVDPLDPETIVVRHHGGGYRDAVPGERRFHVSQGVMGAAVRERRLQRLIDVTRDPRYIPIPGISGIRSEVAVPLLHGPAVLGVLNVESPRVLTEADAANLQTVADHLAAAISNARRFEDAQRVAVLEERHRLARDLHDSITQMVFSASLMAQSLPTTWKRDPEEGERMAERMVGVTRSALIELRAMLHELRPSSPAPSELPDGASELVRLKRDGLATLLRSETTRVTDGTLAIELDLHRYRPQPFEREEALYRVFQEALYNVTKHAHATWVRIRLACENGHVVLQVTDDGIGFEPNQARPEEARGLGRAMMAERVERLDGVLRTISRPGSGAIVEVRVPNREIE